jgi:putative transposase
LKQNPKEDKVTRDKCSDSGEKIKQLRAQEVYQLTSEALQTHFGLDMHNSMYDAPDIWDVLIGAAVKQMTIEMACELLEDAPSPNTVRKMVAHLLGGREKLVELEDAVNGLLVERLPKNLLRQALPCAVDITEIPYHGRYGEGDEGVRRGRAKHGTTHFHCYATLYTVKNNKRYTLAMTLMRTSDKALDVLKRLLAQGKRLGLRLKRLFLDRGFDNNAVVAFLKLQPFPTIMPLTVRGKTGGTRALLTGRKSYQTTYTRSSLRYGEQTFPVYVVCKYSKGHYKRRGVWRFAYVVIGELKMQPHQIFEEYRRRFGIETSYRLMNTVRARTTSTSVPLRLFYVALALLLLNVWSFLKWHHLYIPNHRGPRQVLHHLLPLARYRLWLWEMVKRRLTVSLELYVPLSA